MCSGGCYQGQLVSHNLTTYKYPPFQNDVRDEIENVDHEIEFRRRNSISSTKLNFVDEIEFRVHEIEFRVHEIEFRIRN